jgi:hypothetical protein
VQQPESRNYVITKKNQKTRKKNKVFILRGPMTTKRSQNN